jgi:2-keto-myo-inositol isomerase
VSATPILSFEVFNQEYYKRDALEVARTGLQKMKAVAAAVS